MYTVIDEYIHFWHTITLSSFFCSCIAACLIIVLHSHPVLLLDMSNPSSLSRIVAYAAHFTNMLLDNGECACI
jgi:hypothetical protein